MEESTIYGDILHETFIYVLWHLSFVHAWGARESKRGTHLASEDEERASYACTGIRCFPSFGCFFVSTTGIVFDVLRERISIIKQRHRFLSIPIYKSFIWK